MICGRVIANAESITSGSGALFGAIVGQFHRLPFERGEIDQYVRRARPAPGSACRPAMPPAPATARRPDPIWRTASCSCWSSYRRNAAAALKEPRIRPIEHAEAIPPRLDVQMRQITPFTRRKRPAERGAVRAPGRRWRVVGDLVEAAARSTPRRRRSPRLRSQSSSGTSYLPCGRCQRIFLVVADQITCRQGRSSRPSG